MLACSLSFENEVIRSHVYMTWTYLYIAMARVIYIEDKDFLLYVFGTTWPEKKG